MSPGSAAFRKTPHLQRDAVGYVPRIEMRKTVARELRDVFNAPSREEAERLLGLMAERHRNKAPKLASWLEDAVPNGFTVFALPVAHRRRLRSTNLIESINSQVRRRTRVGGLFPNEASLLRLVSAVLMEISEDGRPDEGTCRKETDRQPLQGRLREHTEKMLQAQRSESLKCRRVTDSGSPTL